MARRVDIVKTLDEGDWVPFQKLVLVFAALAFLVDGIANQALALAVPSLMQDWGLPRGAFASAIASGLVGLAIGAAVGGMLGDRVGRRVVLIASVFIFGLMTVAAAYANGVSALLWIRLFDGLGIGAAIPNGAALISEFTPRGRRPLAIAVGMVFIAIGSVIAGLLAAPILPTFGWKGLFLVLGAIPLVLSVVYLVVLPESPFYLSRRPDRRRELFQVLRKCGQSLSEDCEFVENDSASKKSTPLRVIFEPDVRLSTFAVWVAFFFCLLASYTMFSWVPAMLASLDFPLSLTSLGMTAFSAGGVAGGVAGGWLIEQFGSKKSVLSMAAGGICGALLLGGLIGAGVKDLTILFSALGFEGFFLAGLINGNYTLATLIYPPHARATGVGAAAAVGRLGAIVSAYTGVIALQIGGASGYFFVIAFSIAVSFIGIALVRHHISGSRTPQPKDAPAT